MRSLKIEMILQEFYFGSVVALCYRLFFIPRQLCFFYGELSRGQVVGRDYLNAWTAINLAMDGKYEDIFFPDKFINHAPLNIQSTNVVAYFSYPPQYLLFLIPFSFFTYKISLILWTLTNLMVFYISIRCAFDFSKRNLFIMIFSPVVILNISFGQNGILTGSLFILAVSFIHNKPILSGIFFGLLTIKPTLVSLYHSLYFLVVIGEFLYQPLLLHWP
ncbi:hypothetical protein JCM19232_2840 [Vibrio ishigakensis]|uniref:DUF2029 domain-containing protein n=1 Tax=Vibrio ishigakensis TaxID=1481914 RepID=A0A0B8PSY9_9VIBR|nr:hypothetical protein JCM19232_2840 [Vibrio ishigakensis]